MPSFLNHAAVAAPTSGTWVHTVAPDGTGGTVVAGSGFTPTAGNLLVCVVEGAVTSTTPTGWTLPTGGSAINNSGLYVWYRTAAGGGDSLTTTHNGPNPAVFDFYEFASGSTFGSAASATGVSKSGGAGPSLSGQTGTHTFMAAVGQCETAASTGSVTWASGTEAADTSVANSGGNDGYVYSLAYVDGSTSATFSDAATVTSSSANTCERLVWSLVVAAGGSDGNVTGVAATSAAAAVAPVLHAAATLTAVAATVAVVAIAPTVSGSGNANVSAVATTATATAIAPAVSASSNVAGVAATASAAAVASSVGVGATVTGVSATVTAAAVAPTINLGATVTAVRAQASATAIAPTVTGSGAGQVNAIAATATATAIAPTVTGSASATVTAVRAQVTAAALAPSVSAGSTVTGVHATVTATAIAPTVTAGGNAIVAAVAAPVAAVGRAPVLHAAAAVNVSQIAASVVAHAPAVTGVQPVEIRRPRARFLGSPAGTMSLNLARAEILGDPAAEILRD